MALNLTATVSGVEAASVDELLKHWWQWLLFGVGIASLVTGTSYIAFILCRKLWRMWSRKSEPSDALPIIVSNHLEKYITSRSQLSLEKPENSKPTSLAVYLGGLQNPATADQIRLFESHDMIILDPLQLNVVTFVANASRTLQRCNHITGRLDLAAVCNTPSGKEITKKSIISSLDQILNTVLTRFKNLDGGSNGFTGILLAGWDIFPVAIIHELSSALAVLGLDVYLETSGPDFLQDPSTLVSDSIVGLVMRNALLLPNGERQDCFRMEKLRMTVKAFVSQACLRSFTVLSWDTLDNGVVPPPSILKRTYAWCSFYNAIPWIGSTDALFDVATDVVKFEPLSAFDWLKQPHVMELHKNWATSKLVASPASSKPINDHLRALLPSLQDICNTSSCDHHSSSEKSIVGPKPAPTEKSEWFILDEDAMGDPFNLSSVGKTYDGIGCFPLGVDVTEDDFQEIVWSQRNLKKLDLLDAIPSSTLREYGTAFHDFVANDPIWKDAQKRASLCSQESVLELATTLTDSRYEVSEGVRVFLSLNSGFQRASGKQFWAVYHVHASSVTDIFVSKDAEDLTATIMHTYLSSLGFTRRECLATELAFARWRGDVVLPHAITRRMDQDLSLLSPDECVLLLQRISLASNTISDGLIGSLQSAVRAQLIDDPTVGQLKALNAASYLSGRTSVEDLVASRIRWHCHCSRTHPEIASAVRLFLDIEAQILQALKNRSSHELQRFTDALDSLLSQPHIDAISDIVALAGFCTMRKLAFEEIYVEVTDRNPLFNNQSDQAAAFAELFALGSRCEAYFDVTPSRFGELLSEKFLDFYGKDENQPPPYEESSFALRSAYAEAQIDVDPKHKDTEMPAYQRFTFLSVFAIPALIDILMLTTTGHGLYLSAKMSFQEQHSATVALMISLLVSGAIGTWITCGGTYYLASMAFSAMNYFVVTRLLGGFAFTLAVATVGFIAFTCQSNVSAGIVFFLYFIVLTTYLCLLAALANYQFTGSAFQSGRVVIIFCIPLLFISPVTTIFVQFHDINIYLTVLYFFITMLFVGLRRTGSRWTTWYQKISLLQDSELREWYIQRSESIYKKELEELSDPAVLKLARQTLMRDVVAETKKMFFMKKTKDPLILKLADSFEATDFLMNWYSRYSGVPKPMNFSSAWNVQTKVALESLQKSQLGIRFHNGFIHWRQAGDEIGCTILYFIIALLDKWVMLLTGQQILGLGSSDKDLTLPIGFGLAYYLVGAVLLDFNAHKLFELAAAQGKEEVIPTDSDISAAVRVKAHKRKILYWRTLFRYLMLHVWGLAATSSMIWLFASSDPRHGGFVKHPSRPTIIFLSYVGAYTGLLWYQYTKVFCGPHALKPLLIGVSVGLPVGFILHRVAPKFPYTDIIALGSASWTVAILSLYAAKMIGHQEEHPLSKIDGEYNVYSGPGPDQEWSQPELRGLHNKLSVLPKGERLEVDPNSDFGSQVKLILEKCRYTKLPGLAARAFPEAEKLLELSGKLFDEQCITVELVSVDHFAKYDRAMRAVSSSMNGVVKLLVGCETKGVSANQDPLPAIYQDVGELLIQVTAQSFLGFSSRDAILAQNLWASDDILDNTSSTPSILERRLRASSKAGTTSTLIDHMRKQFLRDLCLGFDCDIDWENLPEDIRQYLISRCLGTPSTLADNQIAYLTERLKLSVGLNFETYLARCDYAAFTGALALSRASSWAGGNESQRAHQSLRHAKSIIDLLGSTRAPAQPSFKDRLILYSGLVYHGAGTICKFFCVAFVADPEYQRELQWTFGRGPKILQTLSRVFFNGIWMVAKSFQMMFLPVFMFKDREHVKTLWKNIQGVEVSFKRSRIIIRSLDGIYTGFIHTVDRETFKLQQYRGNHKSEPVNNTDLCYVNMYSKNMALLRRIELNKGNTINDYVYEYRAPNTSQATRLSKADLLTSPITRKGIAGQDHLQDVNYNYKGQIDSGSYLKDGNIVRFQYHYQKGAKLDGALIRAEFVLPHLSCTVSWCAAPRRRAENLDNWIPHSQVTEATFVVGADVWESKYFYDHKFHPTIVTTLNGQRVDTPPLILYDHLNVLKKPRKISFVDDNPLYSFSSIHSNPLTRWLGFYTRRYPVSTSQARSWLWKAWKEEVGCDGVIVRWLDERLLRRDPVLRPYWRHRDFGDLSAAEDFLDQNRDAVMASVDLDNTISSWTPLAMKINDLYSFGQGGDACSRTRSNVTTQEDDDETALHVIAVDTGTWPNEGGGVSACRSDVINNLRTIKWHMVAESANDFGIPKRQIERNVHSLKVIPLWGLDLLTPTHGLFANRLDSEVDHITTHATLQDIERSFVPILAALISGARALDFSRCDVKQVTRALVNLNAYFKESRHWSEVWRSDVVKNAWRRIWLSQTTANARPSSAWLRTELPTLGQLDQGLELWSRYLFIFSIPIPEKMPAVFQASHHSVSASYGIVCKIKRGCTLQIWDHAISWRETNLYLSSALCPLSPFVRNSLLGLMRMTSILTLHHADTILPCADFFNPNWEVEIGTCQGKIEHRNAFKRKIDPVVNGITEMTRFAPVKEIKTKTPTVTMLSHVWYAKDIKTALLAADIIINQWGFKEYRLDIYGALDKSPAYTTNCQEIIATKSLRHNVALKGEANPIHVLEQTWVFLNSSISEGLPLALGEAALTGAPVVCTDVGASLRVLTNPVDGTCYSAVVAPNDALAMARAQIKMLALLDEFAQYADPELSITSSSSSDQALQTSLPENPTQEDVERITKRMYTQTPARRRLGMKAREIVQKSFSGERYLREHEQMLWIGKARKDMTKPTNARPTTLLSSPKPIFLSNLISAKTYRESGVGNRPRADTDRERDSEMAISANTVRETLPSLAFANSLPSQSIKSDFVSTVGMGRVVEGDWIRSAEGKGVGGAQVRVVDLGAAGEKGIGGSPLRRDRRVVGGVSVSSSVAGDVGEMV